MVHPTAQTIRHRAEVLNLKLLIWLRWFAIGGMSVAVLFVHFALGVPLPLWRIAALIAFLMAVNLVATWRLSRPADTYARTVLADLMVDVAALTLMLFLTGGAQNPFTGLFILLAVVAAFLLPPIEAGVVFVTTVAVQLWLLDNGLPLDLPMNHGHDGPSPFDLHLQGMFLSFFFSAALAVLFILGTRDNLRQRDARLERLAEQMEEEKVVLRLGLLAGTAAHDLGTPLTNLAVILDDWADLGLPGGAEGQRQIALMAGEVAICRERISHMLAMGGQRRLEAAAAVDPAGMLDDLRREWLATAPGMGLRIEDRRAGAGRVMADLLLTRALANLLDNAREAGARNILISLSDDQGRLMISVEDDGPGFPEAVLRGEAMPAPDDPALGDLASHGLGLVLVRSALRRMGGQITLANRAEGGARVQVSLPVVAHG